MDVDMEPSASASASPSPSFFDPTELSIREQYRRYGKRHTPHHHSDPHSSPSKHSLDGSNIQLRPNAALFLEEIKHEVESIESDGTESKGSKRRSLIGERGSEMKLGKFDDEEMAGDGVDSTFALFASLLDSSLQGLMPIPDLILRFERACRNVSESMRYGSNGRHRAVEDKLMRQKARFLLDEAASWSLLWYLYGKENKELPQDLEFPTTSHLAACQFVMSDHTAELCLRIVQWLEGLASEALDLENKVRGCYVGSYLPKSGVWHNTQRLLKKGSVSSATVQHLDFDAPTREGAEQHPDDKKQDESLLEDIWTLLRAGRLSEACELCRAAGQPWRAATLSPFGGLDLFPSVEALLKNGKSRILQGIELESGIGRQWCLWKWASYCASEKIAEQDAGKYEAAIYAAQCSNLRRMLPTCTDWESACWAIAKSWLNVQIDLELSRFHHGRVDHLKSDEDEIYQSPGQGDETLRPESWPHQVFTQQPRDLSALFQKLHSGDIVHDAVSRGCKEQHRQIEMNLMVGDIPHLLDLLWSWISPSEEYNEFRPHGDPQMIRFGAHLVLVLRHLVADQITDAFREKLRTVGDLILHMYAMFLFSKQHEELVGVYASQLAQHRCIDLFVYMMELRLDWSAQVKYKIFQSAMEYLPFSPDDDSKGSFEEIIDRVLSRSREIKPSKFDEKSSDVAEQHRLQSLRKAMAVQWLCFTPPSTVNNVEVIKAKLLSKALIHSNLLFREFVLISMWRSPKMPIGAHTLLSYLAEPLKQSSDSLLKSLEGYHDSAESLNEFRDWREHYSCDATYRNWLKIELENAQVPQVSWEEKQRAVKAAKETLKTSLLLLQREEAPWLVSLEDTLYESEEPTYIELHAITTLCLPSGECICPDSTLCTALTSAFYSSVSEEVLVKRELMVNVSISTTDNYCVEVILRCLAAEGDGLGHHELNDGGILATLMANGFKGELNQFQPGVALEISRLDAWYLNKEALIERPAAYIVRGLCRRCVLPEVILRCMQVSVSLVELGNPPESHDELIDIVASSENGFLHLFSQHQLQEFLLLEREYSILQMEFEEESLEEDS